MASKNLTFKKLFNYLHFVSLKEKNLLKKFLLNSRPHILIIFFIASQKSNQSSLEQICYSISSRVISRSTVQNILRNGLAIGFFEKIINKNDKREKFYKLTKEAEQILDSWSLEQYKIFNISEWNNKLNSS